MKSKCCNYIIFFPQMTNEGEELLPANTDLANECNKEEEANMNRFCFRAGRLPLLFSVPIWI